MNTKTTKRVTRTIVIEGNAEWVDKHLRKTLVAPGKFFQDEYVSVKEIERTTTTTVKESL